MTIGYFGIPGKTGGLTHFVEKGKPICGHYISPRHEYQWCVTGLHFPNKYHRVECKKCDSKNKKAYVME
jgi:hypothetical protein